MLCSLENEMTLPLTPSAIAQALAEKMIFPSMLLCYVVVSLYYGMKCLGGFCQVHDLTVIKTAWQQLLAEAGEEAEAQALTPVQTKELGGDGMVLAYLRSDANVLVPATGLDMITYSGDTSFKKYIAFSKALTLSEVMSPMLPEMYTVLYPFPERDTELTVVSPEQIARATGLSEKARQINQIDHRTLPAQPHAVQPAFSVRSI
jgi:hypothetical protein